MSSTRTSGRGVGNVVPRVKPRHAQSGRKSVWHGQCNLDHIQKIIEQMFWVAVELQKQEDEIASPPDFIKLVRDFVDEQSKASVHIKQVEIVDEKDINLPMPKIEAPGQYLYPFKLPMSHEHIGDHLNIKAPFLLEQATLNIQDCINGRNPHKFAPVRQFALFQVELLQEIRINFPNPKDYSDISAAHWFFTTRLKTVLQSESAKLEVLLDPKTSPFLYFL